MMNVDEQTFHRSGFWGDRLAHNMYSHVYSHGSSGSHARLHANGYFARIPSRRNHIAAGRVRRRPGDL